MNRTSRKNSISPHCLYFSLSDSIPTQIQSNANKLQPGHFHALLYYYYNVPGDTLNTEVHWGKALHIHDGCIETKHCLGCDGGKIDHKNCFEVFKTVRRTILQRGRTGLGNTQQSHCQNKVNNHHTAQLFKAEMKPQQLETASLFGRCGLGSHYKMVFVDWTQQHHAKDSSQQLGMSLRHPFGSQQSL